MELLSRILWPLFFLLNPGLVLAVDSPKVVISEIGWMGTINSASDEWLELYNNASNPINLDGWTLKSDDGTLEIKLSGTIPANGFYLLERTDDNTLPEIAADLIYKGALGNEGEYLKLSDNLNNLIDEVNCSEKWLAGDNATKQTMERVDSGKWQTSFEPGGTPKKENSNKNETESGSLYDYPAGVIFNEILPSPEGSDETEEWFEIFNQNDFKVDLAGWQIMDELGQTKIYTFPAETIIEGREYLVLRRPETKITLNNSSDALKLIQPNGKVIDSVSFKESPLGQSFSRNPDTNSWFWTENLSPGKVNPLAAGEKEENKKTETDQNFTEDKKLAEISQAFKTTEEKDILFIFKPWALAGLLSIFSGTTILILKRKLKEY